MLQKSRDNKAKAISTATSMATSNIDTFNKDNKDMRRGLLLE
jgi:hypothetical protein